MMERTGYIQVFEHQYLRVGEKVQGVLFTQAHFEALARHADVGEGKFFAILHQGIRFSSYVGVLQAGGLTIEILPKASRPGQQDHRLWQQALLDMLRECRLLKVEHLSAASLSLRPNSILNLYITLFLEETESLLRQGLARTYSRQTGNVPVLKGRLLFQRHLQENLARAAHFYTDHEQYGYEHLFNRIIGSALQVLQHFPLDPALEARYRQLLNHFPEVSGVEVTQLEWEQLSFGRKTARYQPAVEAALLILRNYRPDIRSGRQPLIAILFDMNLLFEEYVFRQLAKLQTEELQVYRQLSRPFWERRYVRPDIVLEYKGQRFVLDTKWKVLKRANPNMEDLRQMFVYSQYFDARHGVLVYPQAYGVEDLAPAPFVEYAKGSEPSSCQAIFIDVVADGKLNRSLGKELLDKISGA